VILDFRFWILDWGYRTKIISRKGTKVGKSEARSTKSETNSNDPNATNSKRAQIRFEVLNFPGFDLFGPGLFGISIFGFRIFPKLFLRKQFVELLRGFGAAADVDGVVLDKLKIGGEVYQQFVAALDGDHGAAGFVA